MNSKELRNKIATLLTEQQSIALAGFTSESRAKFDKIQKDVEQFEADAQRMQGMEARDAENRSFERSPRPGVGSRGAGVGSGSEQRKRANEAMRSYMLEGRVNPEYRDILTTNGGASLVPQAFLPELQQALKWYGPIATLVKTRVTPGSAEPLKVAKMDDSANGLALIATEGSSSPAETDPTTTNAIVGADTLSTGLIKISVQEVEDSYFDFGTLIAERFAVRYGRGFETAITTGKATDGTALPNFPTGGLVGAATSALTTASIAAGISYENLVSVYGALDTAYIQNASWVMHPTTRAYLLGLVDGFGRPFFQPNPSTAEPFAFMLGLPVVLNSSMPQMGANAVPLLLGDLQRSFFVRKDTETFNLVKLSERYMDTLEYGYFGWLRAGGAIIAPSSVTALASLTQAAS